MLSPLAGSDAPNSWLGVPSQEEQQHGRRVGISGRNKGVPNRDIQFSSFGNERSHRQQLAN